MERPLDSTAVLRWLYSRVSEPSWRVASTVLTGKMGGRALLARRFQDVVTIALTLERQLATADKACLLLAATPEALDDALYVADGFVWLLRRYPPVLTETELELLIKQQQSVASLLSDREIGEATTLPIAGKYV